MLVEIISVITKLCGIYVICGGIYEIGRLIYKKAHSKKTEEAMPLLFRKNYSLYNRDLFSNLYFKEEKLMKKIAKFGLAVLGEAAVLGFACYEGVKHGMDGMGVYLTDNHNENESEEEKKEERSLG